MARCIPGISSARLRGPVRADPSRSPNEGSHGVRVSQKESPAPRYVVWIRISIGAAAHLRSAGWCPSKGFATAGCVQASCPLYLSNLQKDLYSKMKAVSLDLYDNYLDLTYQNLIRQLWLWYSLVCCQTYADRVCSGGNDRSVAGTRWCSCSLQIVACSYVPLLVKKR